MRVFVFFISSSQCFLSTHGSQKGTITGGSSKEQPFALSHHTVQIMFYKYACY